MNRRQFLVALPVMPLAIIQRHHAVSIPSRDSHAIHEMCLASLNNVDTTKVLYGDSTKNPYAYYRGWRFYKIPTISGNYHIAATRYEFSDLRSPVVHIDCSHRSYSTAEIEVRLKIDTIEAEGFDNFMARNYRA